MLKKQVKYYCYRYLLTLLLVGFIFSIGPFVKAVPVSSIPAGYIPYRSEYTALYFGENLDNEVYFDTSISISVPSLSRNVFTILNTGGWFTYNNVRYNSLFLSRTENGETGVEVARVRFYNTASDDISSDILTYDYSLGTYIFSWSSQIKNASPTIIVEDNVRIYNASSTAEGASILNDILFSAMYVKYIPDEQTTYNVRLAELSQEGFVSILTSENEAENIDYSINDESTLSSLPKPDFPRTLESISSITIYNNSTLELGILASYDDSFRILAPGASYEYTIIENTTLYFGFEENSTGNFQIEGYYYFNDNINFPPNDLSQFSFIANISGNEYEYMQFDTSNNSLWYYGDSALGIDDVRAWYSLSGGSKLYYEEWSSIDLFIFPTTVNESTYNWLNDNGTWGYWTPPDDNPNLDFSVGTFLIDSLDNFLAFEIYQGFTLLQLLYLVIAIPLLIYILKLFMGG